MTILLAALLAMGVVPRSAPAVTPGALAVSPALIPAPDDFSSTYRGYWWDFDEESHYAVEGDRGWSASRLASGWWEGTSAGTGGTIRLSPLHIDSPPTNWEPSEHRHTPFDPAYRYLSVRMCAGAESHAIVRWHRNLTFADGDFGGTVTRKIPGGCSVQTFDLVSNGSPAYKMPWNQAAPTFYAFEILPVRAAGIDVSVDYATLSTSPTGAEVAISWNHAVEPVDLFFSSSSGGERPTPIAAGLSGGPYLWKTPNLAPGTYHLMGRDAAGQPLASAVLVVDAPPRGALLAPSYTSGPDYASGVVRNAWDMSDRSDIRQAFQVSGASFRNGIYSATSLAAPNAANPSRTGDPGVLLNIAAPIDTRRYRYLTYRLWVDDKGLRVGNGGVTRIFWYRNDSYGPVSVTQDIRLYRGWRTVTVDLATALLEPMSRLGPWGRGPVTGLRIDPHESAVPRLFKIDWVKLTGNIGAGSAYRIRYLAQDTDGTPPRAEFFTSGKRTPQGASPIVCQPDPAPPAGPGLTCVWDTASLPAGNHYVHMRLSDRAGNRTWVSSELPLIRR